METFCTAKLFVDHPDYTAERTKALDNLKLQSIDPPIDPPIADIVKNFARLPHCFTLQTCYGHFVHPGQPDPNDTGPLADCPPDAEIEYRIAYMAFCLQNSPLGHTLFNDLQSLTKIDPQYIQFGSANWFWQRCVNTYAVQVEPDPYKNQDTAMVSRNEALHLETIRNKLFDQTRQILVKHLAQIAE